MHHHLFPSEDTYITNQTGYESKNFGIDEILRIGTEGKTVKVKETTKPYTYSGIEWNDYCVTNFTGILTGSFIGAAEVAYGWIECSASFSSSYFSGSVDAGPITEISGWISGYVSGLNTGSLLTVSMPNFSGSLTSSYGHITGTVTGEDIINQIWWNTTTTKYVDRTLIKFNLDAISQSISSGQITNPKFELNLKVCNEYQLPISYKIYAFPVSQSWMMGNGYLSDGGSDLGASWYYKDQADGGNPWYAPITTSVRPSVDFLNDPTNATASFAYGGGTWYYTTATQSFSYESADIRMDVTNIVNDWLNNTIPNEGFILISSDEISQNSSGFSLTFYGKDTNSINSPYLDVMWDDSVWISGSLGTSSIEIINENAGIVASITSGSSIETVGGISGSFSGNIVIRQIDNYITASNATFKNTYVQNFSGYLEGYFHETASYLLGSITASNASFYAHLFTGDIDGTATTITSGSVAGTLISGSLVGYVETSSPLGIFSGSIISSFISLSGSVSGYYLDTLFNSFEGFVDGKGINGGISGQSISGNAFGIIAISETTTTLPTDIITFYPHREWNEMPYSIGYQILSSNTPYNNAIISSWYYWVGDVWISSIPAFPTYPYTSSCGKTYQAKSMVGTFSSGPYSGSQFISYYSDNKILFGTLSGSISNAGLMKSTINIPLPSGIEPYAYAYVSGPFVNGKALGIYTISSSINPPNYSSASFSGQFIDGNLIGSYLSLQLTGSVNTSSFSYTGSIETTSSAFSSLDTNQSFTVIIKNLKPEYKSGDIPRISVFGRKEFPLKTFGKTSQQLGYIVPELLPTSSYYAIKDNMSEEIIVDFDNYTRISCDYPNGNFFMLDTTGLAQERPYRILIRIEDSNSKYTFDNGYVFKITR